jgi:osmoprotectant transport system substrate-binding protein
MRRALAALCLLLAAAAGCGSRDAIVVGSKNFTEQMILGELLAEMLESLGAPVTRRLGLGGTFVCDTAIRAGQIDVYVEYTGTALTAIMKQPAIRDPTDALNHVRASYEKLGLVWTSPLGFDNSFALVIRGEDARKLNIRTISDAVPFAAEWRAGFGYEFRQRQDGYAGLHRTYGLLFKYVRLMDLGLLYPALNEGQVDLVAGNATDAQIGHFGMVILEDDKDYFPPYEAVPVARKEALERDPRLQQMIDKLAGKIDAATMQKLNFHVDGEHRNYIEVVRKFREESGL